MWICQINVSSVGQLNHAHLDNGKFDLVKYYKIPLKYTGKISLKYLSNLYLHWLSASSAEESVSHKTDSSLILAFINLSRKILVARSHP